MASGSIAGHQRQWAWQASMKISMLYYLKKIHSVQRKGLFLELESLPALTS